ncbi:DUF2182 domain-containing protein [Halomarina litorea]|uniref:DUF2182 domain-containing protein n=1 Tax=Halomarina litorea TaxID=2961595 RepID=UPI0020C54C9A|nr:DUF2182 domain-containing protein [Halomarina sp. BCD28]
MELPRYAGRVRTTGVDGTALVAVAVYLVVALAWDAMVFRWLPMPGADGSSMSMDMAAPGVPEAMATGSGATGWALYLLMWGVMMIAMMYPSSVPLVRLYYRTLTGVSTRAKSLRVGAFLGTYTLVWTATGLVPLAANRVVPITAVGGSEVLLGGTLLLLAGYQLSSYKDRCLRHCRLPLGYLMQHHRPGVRGASRMGLEHAWFCLGCCWALFAFMVVVGTMNLVWMVLITAVLSLERTVSWGDTLARGVGVAAGVAGCAVLFATLLGG